MGTYLQFRLPLTSMFPYASILSLTAKSPENVMPAPDLTEPSTSMGPLSSIEVSDLTLFFLLTRPRGPGTEGPAADEELDGMVSSRTIMFSYWKAMLSSSVDGAGVDAEEVDVVTGTAGFLPFFILWSTAVREWLRTPETLPSRSMAEAVGLKA